MNRAGVGSHRRLVRLEGLGINKTDRSSVLRVLRWGLRQEKGKLRQQDSKEGKEEKTGPASQLFSSLLQSD